MINIFKKNSNPFIVSRELFRELKNSRPAKGTDLLCHAPFKSMLFIQSGDAKVCHYNRGYTLGKYPDNSLHELWFGEQRKQFKEYIKKKNLSLGCHDCMKNLIRRDFHAAGNVSYDYLANLNQTNDYPVMMDFQLCNHCNLECFMCSGEYSSAIREHRDKEKAFYEPWDTAFLDQLDEFIPYLKAASFTGGEPMLIDIYYEIWGKFLILNPDIDIYLSTNSSVFPERFSLLMDKLRFNFTISIDSIEKSTYEFIRKNASYNKTIENIWRLHEYCQNNKRIFLIKCCLIKQNALEFPGFLEYWNSHNILVFPKIVTFPPYAAIAFSSTNEIKNILNEYKKLKIETNNDVQNKNNWYLKSIIGKLELLYNQSLTQRKDLTLAEKNCSELKKIILDKIEKHLLQVYSNDKTTNKERMIDHENFIEQVCSGFKNDEDHLKKALIFLTEYPVENLISELERNSPEKMIARFNQAAL